MNMGRLPPDQARAVAMGAGPQVPLPRMAGLDGPPAPMPGPPGYTLQVTGAPPPGYAPQVTGGYRPQSTGGSYAPQVTGAPGYSPQITGGAPAPGYMPAPAAGYTGGRPPAPYQPQLTGYPPISAEDMSRYKAQFAHLDRDGDGLVQVRWAAAVGL